MPVGQCGVGSVDEGVPMAAHGWGDVGHGGALPKGLDLHPHPPPPNPKPKPLALKPPPTTLGHEPRGKVLDVLPHSHHLVMHLGAFTSCLARVGGTPWAKRAV